MSNSEETPKPDEDILECQPIITATDSENKPIKLIKEKKKRRGSKRESRPRDSTDGADVELVVGDDAEGSGSTSPDDSRDYPFGGQSCALCYCGEKSLLGQGDLTRYSPTSGFNPFKKSLLRSRGSREFIYASSPIPSDNVEKVTKTAAVQRKGRDMKPAPSGRPLLKNDAGDELSNVGTSEVLDVGLVFEATGHVTAHHCCAAWSEGVTQNENYNLLCVDKAVFTGMAQRCHYCSQYGATIKCKANKCEKLFHYPCAAGSGCFQDIKSMSLLCLDHLELAPSIAVSEELNCAVCDDPGEISDLLFCTSCGHHYHGDCLDPNVDVNPVVRAGWQCPECKICQTCRQPGDDNKMLVCDVCDKGYHTFCLKPAMTFIPKNGWCCKTCRRCTDCGSRTPGNGPSSKWHFNYQVCDPCYQLRNRGSVCPICKKAYRLSTAPRGDMINCNLCKKWLHVACESDALADGKLLDASSSDYRCSICIVDNPMPPVSEAVPPDIETEMDTSQPPSALDTSQQSTEDLSSTATTIADDSSIVIPPPPVEETPPSPQPLKRNSTSSSIGSDKGAFALKGSSTDPMLYDEDERLGRFGSVNSPTLKVRVPSSEGNKSRRFSAESNMSSSLFADDSAQDSLHLFGDDSLHSPGFSKQLSSTAVGLDMDKKPVKMSPLEESETSQDFSASPITDSKSYSMDSPVMAIDSPVSAEKPPGPGLGKPGAMFGKPFVSKKKPAVGKVSKGKGKGFSSKGKSSKNGSVRRRTSSTFGRTTISRRQRSRFPKQTNVPPPNTDLCLDTVQSYVNTVVCSAERFEDEYGDSMHNTVVLCSSDDTFTLCQDMCVVCGSFGQSEEGRLISCAQCGQSYHPYCVNLKLSKVVLRKGWRCLDCTVCEECGDTNDPAHLLLCDDCDISYHTHCLSPPLQHVPKGGWKCKWCVRCLTCNTTSPGTNCEWMMNYTACGPCASLQMCPKCKRYYKDEDVIMQCETCARWIHSICENLIMESDIERVIDKGYQCMFCRPADAPPPHMLIAPPVYDDNDTNMYQGRTRSEAEPVKEYQKDFTSLTVAGYQHIQKQMQQYMGMNKKKPTGARRRTQQRASTDSVRKPTVKVAAVVIKPLDLTASKITSAEGEIGTEVDSTLEKPSVADELQSPMDSSFVSPDKHTEDAIMHDVTEETTVKIDEVEKVKRKRKPYRPGIGGFTIRQRGRGSGIVKRSTSRLPSRDVVKSNIMPMVDAALQAASNAQTVQNRTVSQADAFPNPPQGAHIDGITKNNGKSDVTSASNATTATVQEPSNSSVTPFKLKLASSKSSKRKKRTKLIDQFPQYLQDAFFGKHVISESKKKSNPLEGLQENTSSMDQSHQDDHASHIFLPERLTQGLSSQAHTDRRQQEEDMMMMDKDNEDLLAVLPNLRDEEMLRIFSGQEHTSELKEMDIGLDIGSDLSHLFSDVMTHDAKQDDEMKSHEQETSKNNESVSSQAANSSNASLSSQSQQQQVNHSHEMNMQHQQQQQSMVQSSHGENMTLGMTHMSHHMPPHHHMRKNSMESGQQGMPGVTMSRQSSMHDNRQGNMMQPHIMPHVDRGSPSLAQQHSSPSSAGLVENQHMISESLKQAQYQGQQFQQMPGSNKQNFDEPLSGQGTPSSSTMPSRTTSPSSNTPSGGQTITPNELPDFAGNDSNIFEPSPRPWPLAEIEGDSLSVNQRNILKWEKDEPLGDLATISPVLYANIKFPNLKNEFPDWPTRAKQVAKLWRKASPDERAPFLQKARDNRALLKSTRSKRAEVIPPEVKHESNPQLQTPRNIMPSNVPQSPLGSPMTTGQQPHGVMQPNIKQQFVSPSYWPQQQSHSPTILRTQSPTSGSVPGGNGPWQGTFAKPKPPSRDPTPRPQSPANPMTRPSFPMGMVPSGNVSPRGPMPQWSQQRMMTPQGAGPFRQPFPGPNTGQIMSPTGQPDAMWSQQQHMPATSPMKLQPKVERQQSLDSCFKMHDPTHGNMQSADYFHQKPSSLSLPCSPSVIQQQMDQPPFQRMSNTPRMPQNIIHNVPPVHTPTGFSPNVPVQPGSHSTTPQPQNIRQPFPERSTESGQTANPDVPVQTTADKKEIKTETTDKSTTNVVQPLPQSSPIREVLYNYAQQRRARLFEQQTPWNGPPQTDITRPPPPYPGQVNHNLQQQSFEGQSQQLVRPPPGQLMQRGFNMANVNMPGQPPMSSHGGFPHRPPMGQQPHMMGGFIELRHSKQTDPATRRQEIMRMGAGLPTTQGIPTSDPTFSKPSDIFSGTQMPHDEHIDALLSSGHFKDLQFHTNTSTTSEAVSATTSTAKPADSTTTSHSVAPVTDSAVSKGTTGVTTIATPNETTIITQPTSSSEKVVSAITSTSTDMVTSSADKETASTSSTQPDSTASVIIRQSVTSTETAVITSSTSVPTPGIVSTTTSHELTESVSSKPVASEEKGSGEKEVQEKMGTDVEKSSPTATEHDHSNANADQEDKQKDSSSKLTDDTPTTESIADKSNTSEASQVGSSTSDNVELDKSKETSVEPTAVASASDKPNMEETTMPGKDTKDAKMDETNTDTSKETIVSLQNTQAVTTTTMNSTPTTDRQNIKNDMQATQEVKLQETDSIKIIKDCITSTHEQLTVSESTKMTVVSSEASSIADKDTNAAKTMLEGSVMTGNAEKDQNQSVTSSGVQQQSNVVTTVSNSATTATSVAVPLASNVNTSPLSSTSSTTDTQSTPRKRPLLIKEQPLLLQDLVEKEKMEQERARLEKQRQSQTILQQQPLPLHTFPPPAESENIPPDPNNMLTKINQPPPEVPLPVVPPVQRLPAPHQPQMWQQMHPAQPVNQPGGGFAGDVQTHHHRVSYEQWLIQQRNIIQSQIRNVEGILAQKRQTKKSLQQKQRSWKKQNREILPEDAQMLQTLTKIISESQQQLDKHRSELKQHMDLIQEYNSKQQQNQQQMMPAVPTIGMPGQPQMAVKQFSGGAVNLQQMNMMPPMSTGGQIISGVVAPAIMTTQQQQQLQQQQALFQIQNMRPQNPAALHHVVPQGNMTRPIIPQQMPFITSQQQITPIQNQQPGVVQGQSNQFIQMQMQMQMLVQQQGQQKAMMQGQQQVPEKPKRKRKKKKKPEEEAETPQQTSFQISHHPNPQGQFVGMQQNPQIFQVHQANFPPNQQMMMQGTSAVRMQGGAHMHTHGNMMQQPQAGNTNTSFALLPTLPGTTSHPVGTQQLAISSDGRQRMPMPALPTSGNMQQSYAAGTTGEMNKQHMQQMPNKTMPGTIGGISMATTLVSKEVSGANVTVVTATSTQPTVPTAIQVKRDMDGKPTVEQKVSSMQMLQHQQVHKPIYVTPQIATPERKLTEAELDMLMRQDPDLNHSRPSSTQATHERAIAEQQQAREPRSSLDDVMDSVVESGVKYSNELKEAEKTGAKVTPPSWLHEPKQVFVDERGQQFMGNVLLSPMHGQKLTANHQELLKHLLHKGQMGLQQGDMSGQMFSQIHPGMMNLTPQQQEQLKAAGGIPNFMMGQQQVMKMPPDGQKKKRSRRSSKDVEGGQKRERKRKKSKNKPQQQMSSGQMMMGSAGSGMVMLPNGAMVPASGGQMMTMGQLQSNMNDPSKQPATWKPLPVLSLVEPEIKPNHHICLPKGTGLAESGCDKKYLSNTNVPDFYNLLVPVEEPQSPPTPPPSSPPSPSPANQSKDGVESTNSMQGRPHLGLTTLSSGIMELDKDHSMAVRVPESLPTPPHHGLDAKEDGNVKLNVTEESIPPSSPEMEGEDAWSLMEMMSLEMKTQQHPFIHGRDSPDIPLMLYPKINIPPKLQTKPIDDKENVSVTIEFDIDNAKMIKKSLTLLSHILGTNIVNFNMEESVRPDLKSKPIKPELADVTNAKLSQDNKDEPQRMQQRRCTLCMTPVIGNGVRKPPPKKSSLLHEDIIFCNKDCFLQHEIFMKKPEVTPIKKKFKVSHIYQRHTVKMSMEALFEQFPEAVNEPVVATRGQRSADAIMMSTPTAAEQLRQLNVNAAAGRGRGRRRGSTLEEGRTAKRWRGLKWKKWTASDTVVKHTRAPIDIASMLHKYGSNIKASSSAVDRRECMLCGCRGDGNTKEVARLLNVDVDKWVHLNCALWSAEVYETQGGALMNVDLALRRSENVLCCMCQRKGATIHCHRPRCVNTYHCRCAIQIKCAFFKDKTVLCPSHAPTNVVCSNDMLQSLAVFRKVYVQRPETKQIASIMQQGELAQGEKHYVLRVGSLIFTSVGQLSTHHMDKFHNKNAIFPIGYKASRIYWSSTNHRRRCRYNFSVTERDGRPWFTISFMPSPPKQKHDKNSPAIELEERSIEGPDVNEICRDILLPLRDIRSQHSVLKLFPAHISGEKMFGFTSPVVARILESLPNIELCSDYKFRYGRSPLLELPLAINPTGSARSEPYIRQNKKKPHTLISNLISEYYESTGIGEASSLYGKQFVHCKSSQYRKMKQEWKQNVYLARSRIQGLGLFAARDIEPGTMVIEYIGDIIRVEVSEKREKQYELANRGVYMFRLDSDHIVDATVSGGPARYINHSCNPNCVAEVVNFEKEKKIMIISYRNILKGEELCYDYKFDFEDEGQKIPCLCGAPNCKKWMN